MKNVNKVVIDGKEYQVVITPDVMKDVCKGKSSIEGIKNTLLASKKLPDIKDDTFYLENSDFNMAVCGCKKEAEAEIEILMAVYRENMAKIEI